MHSSVLSRALKENVSWLAEDLKAKLVKTWFDHDSDAVMCRVDMRVDVTSVVDSQPGALLPAMRKAISDATVGLRYDQRSRPRLGAGSIGYARRRR